MTDIKWPEGTVALLRARKHNVHYPQKSFMTYFSLSGSQVKGASDDGRMLCAYLEDWELIERPAEPWNGEGLPPVGTECELNHVGEVDSKGIRWNRVIIFAHYSDARLQKPVAIYMPLDGTAHCDQAIAECFRPIRTPEQIAAEEREHAAITLYKDMVPEKMQVYWDVFDFKEDFYRAIDAGYRKQAKE